MATRSLCMIVKDEEEVLARCLESAAGIADEIIIVDTGSSDRTVEIAKEYTNQVYSFAWIDDFAAARNYAFSLASADFCMWLDADDVLLPEDRTKLLALKQDLVDVDTVMLRYNTAFDAQGRPVFSYWRERIVRNCPQALWLGAVHEVIAPFGKIIHPDIAVTHRKEKPAPPGRNLRIFESLLSQGKTLSPREQFYYGRELYYNGRYADSVEVLERFLAEQGGWLENNIEACRFISYCAYHLGDEDTALRSLLRTLVYDLPRAETCCELGRHFFDRAKYHQAVYWYQEALRCPKDELSGGFISPDCYGYLPCIQLCVCYYRLGNLEQAIYYNEQAGTYKPEAKPYLDNKQFFAKAALEKKA